METPGTPIKWPPLPSSPSEKEAVFLSWSLRLKRAAPALLRLSLALVFLWFGFTQLVSPLGWVSYLPKFLTDLDINPTFFIFLNGAFEVLLSSFLFLGVFVRPASFFLGAHLFGITYSLGLTPIGVRDFGLSFAVIAVSFYGDDFYTLNEFLKRKKLLEQNKLLPVLYNSFLVLLAGGILVYSFYTFLVAIEADKATKLAQGDTVTKINTVGLPLGEILSLDILAKHNKKEDCWLLLNNKIYNVTSYVTVHPGGVSQIVTRCGTDATGAFNTKGGIGTHSAYASDLLENYYVGEFGKAVTSVAGGPAVKTPPKEVSSSTNNTPTKKLTTITPTPAPTTKKPLANTGISLATLTTHKTQSNCWLLISGKIYNVTDYIPVHPGGTNQIVNNCGTDATTAFNTKGGGGNTHSNYAKTLLANYYVGDLGAVTNPNQTQPQTDTVSPIVSFSSPSGGATLSGTASVSASASDTGGILSVRFSIDGSVLITNMSAPYSYYLTTANYGNGSHTLTALATDTSGNTSSATVVVTINNQVTGGGTTSTTLTMAEIATHNTQGNCWLLVNNKVYNVATYINVHPGGVNQIVNNCGIDSTTAFNTKGGKGSNHSNNAQNLLTGYYIGDLGGTTTGGGTTGGTGGGTGGTTTLTTHAVTVTSTGTISPTSLTIKVGDKAAFTYTNPNDEVILTFSPQPPNDIKLDKEKTTKSYTFLQTGTYNYTKKNGGGTSATITVQ